MHSTLYATDIMSIISLIKKIMDENRDYLIELDSVMGDGDLGITMTKGFTAANEEVSKSLEKNPGKIFIVAGMAIAKSAPSTMGTLTATGFMKGGKAVSETGIISTEELAIFFQAFTQGIMERGKAKPGDKTIIDVLHPAAMSLLKDAENKIALQQAINNAFIVAEEALKSSSQLKAQFGRAAYYQDDSIGKQDAGATAGLLILKAFYLYITDTSAG